MINFEWLRSFKAIYDEGNMTKASEALFLSQPGISLHLSSLENHVGFKLFERTPRKMKPTEMAIILYNYISEPLQKLENTEKYFQRKKSERKTLSIGMCSEVFQYFIEENIEKLNFDIIAHFGEYPQMLKELEDGILDFVITPEKNNNLNIEYKSFFEETVYVVANKDYDTTEIEDLINKQNWDQLERILINKIWYGAENTLNFAKRFFSLNFESKNILKFNYIVPNIISILRCIKSNKGLALIPDFLCNNALQNNEIKFIWKGRKDLTNTFYFAKRNDTDFKLEIHQIEEIIKSKLKDSTS